MTHNDEKFDVRLQFVYKTKPKVTTTHHHNHPKNNSKDSNYINSGNHARNGSQNHNGNGVSSGMPTPVSVVTTTHLPMDLLNYLTHPQQQRLQI